MGERLNVNTTSEKLRKEKEAKRKKLEKERLRLQQAVITVGCRAITHMGHIGGGGEDGLVPSQLEDLGLPQDLKLSSLDQLKAAVNICKSGRLSSEKIARRFLAVDSNPERATDKVFGDKTLEEDQSLVLALASAVETVFEEVKDKRGKPQSRRISIR